MKIFTKKSITTALAGLSIGIINGLLGAGGGMIAVPLLNKLGLSQKESHANAIAVILPITLLSSILYLINGYVKISDALIYMPTGIVGALIGTAVLKKISPVWLKRIFGAVMVYAGIRLLLR